MKKETLYFDTSVPSAYYDKRAKERQEQTIAFWKEIVPQYRIFISEVTTRELADTKDARLRTKFFKLVQPFKLLKTNSIIQDLAEAYVEHGIIPEKYIDDALHLAVASYNNIHFIVSWNFDHIVKVKTRKLIKSVNTLKGFSEIEIVAPIEL